MGRRVDHKTIDLLLDTAREGIEQLKRLDFVIEELHPEGELEVLGGEDIDRVPPNSKHSSGELDIVAGVLHPHELADEVALGETIAHPHGQYHCMIVSGVANAVDARDRGHNDGVLALEERLGGRQAHLLDVLIDGRVFFNEQIALGHIGLGLVVIVVGDEVLDGIARKKLPHLRVELGGQSLVRRQDQCGTSRLGNDMGHGEGLPRAGHPQKRLVGQTRLQPVAQAFDGRRLIAGRLEGRHQFVGAARVRNGLKGHVRLSRS